MVGLSLNGSISLTVKPAARMLAMMLSAIWSRPMLRKAPARRPATVLWPPVSKRLNTSEASVMRARAARISMARAAKWLGAQAMRAAGRRMRRMPPFVSMSSGRGSSRRTSKIDTPWSRAVGLLPPFGDLTSSCLGTVQSPVWRLIDCSALRHHTVPKRSLR